MILKNFITPILDNLLFIYLLVVNSRGITRTTALV
jgi:hypothetical protein